MGLLQGIKVVELAQWIAVPAAILSDWGAEVVKIEHPSAGAWDYFNYGNDARSGITIEGRAMA